MYKQWSLTPSGYFDANQPAGRLGLSAGWLSRQAGHRVRSLWAASKIGTVFRVIKWLEKFVVRPQNRECVIVYQDTLKESLNLHSTKIGTLFLTRKLFTTCVNFSVRPVCCQVQSWNLTVQISSKLPKFLVNSRHELKSQLGYEVLQWKN